MLHYICLLAVLSADNEEWPTLWPTLPPVIQDSPFEKIRVSNLGGEYAAPIPDSLIVHKLVDAGGSEIQIILKKPVPKKELERLPGPSWQKPHSGCSMCTGNALIGRGYDESYLRSLTYTQWDVLWDNEFNGPKSTKKSRGEGYIGYEAGGSTYQRRRLLGRWR